MNSEILKESEQVNQDFFGRSRDQRYNTVHRTRTPEHTEHSWYQNSKEQTNMHSILTRKTLPFWQNNTILPHLCVILQLQC